MDNKYYAYNQTRECFLSGALTAVDAGLEPLRVLKVLIEGLSPNAKSGLWLTHFRSVPVARTLSPFDLIYLDNELRVVHAVELSTDGEFTPFRGQPASALVLPQQSIASTHTRTGDQLIIRLADEAARPDASREANTAQVIKHATPIEVAAEPASTLAGVAQPVPVADNVSSPLEAFLARQSAISAGRGHAHAANKSLLDLSPAEQAPVPTTQSPIAKTAPAIAEPANVSRPSIHAVPSPPQVKESRSGPTRAGRIASPPLTPSTSSNSGAALDPTPGQAHHISVGGAKQTPSKVEQFPVRKSPGAAAGAPPRVSEPQFRPSDIDDFRSQPSEKTSVLMKILRLQFLKGDRSERRNIGIPEIDTLKESAVPKRTIPDWTMRFLRWMYPEYDIATVAEVIVQPSYNEKTKFQPEATPSLDLQFVKWLYPELTFNLPQLETTPSDRRVSARLPKPGLVAYYFTGGPPRAHRISNISVTGFYMNTDERWMPGTIIRMTLQMVDSKGDEPMDTLTVHSRVVRWGPDGEGFEFVLSGFFDESLNISYRSSGLSSRRLKS